MFVMNLPSQSDHRDSMSLAASLRNISLNWIDGVKGITIVDAALPPGDARGKINNGAIGSWRAHMNTLQYIVEKNLSSALILEDDVDWDIRIKPLLHNFALSSQALIQPLTSNPSKHADPSYHLPNGAAFQPLEMYLDQLPSTIPPSYSPYGDSWELLWLGYCGVRFPNDDLVSIAAASKIQPKGRVIHLNDETVPEIGYLGSQGTDLHAYPPHTRVIHHVVDTVCTFGYSVNIATAQRILYDMAIKKFTAPFDIMLREVCEGTTGRMYLHCLTSQPILFSQHWPVGRTEYDSDISEHNAGEREKAFTSVIRKSVKMNFDKLTKGETTLDDQLPGMDSKQG